MKINKEWHLKNRMPKNPSMDKTINWNIEHLKNCACREIPDTIRIEIVRMHYSVKKRKKGKKHNEELLAF